MRIHAKQTYRKELQKNGVFFIQSEEMSQIQPFVSGIFIKITSGSLPLKNALIMGRLLIYTQHV